MISLAFQSTTRDEDGITSTDYPAIPRVINFQVRLGCLFAYNAALLILRYFGYSSPALDQWAAAAPLGGSPGRECLAAQWVGLVDEDRDASRFGSRAADIS